ncbi:hypothetical protein ARMSODRAFT_245032 [Armillaria solidipes]|uniref:Uncharacterized protein n=1 Tax=Armillaria solidipes TaxID=1076256 RepID=A0A2H3CNC7_9AGAR|nr:hypothetical protein ARMSODRAFT_245032 [Armillaria solidipes]
MSFLIARLTAGNVVSRAAGPISLMPNEKKMLHSLSPPFTAQSRLVSRLLRLVLLLLLDLAPCMNQVIRRDYDRRAALKGR